MPPYINHPARVAERIATLDLISDGRCDFGSGAGATETELGGFNVPQSEKKDMFLEGMRIAIRMMVEQPFAGYKSKYLDVPQRNVMPKPLQKPHPPLWMACSRRESILQAARLGVGALTFSFVGPEQARQWREDYYRAIEEESEPIGYAVNPQFAIACPFLCDKDAKRMEQIGMENYGFFVYGLGHYSFFGEHEPGRTDIWDEFKNRPREFAMPEGRIQDCVGTPDMLRARLREFEDVGIDQVVCISQAGKIPHELLCSSIELFSREVLPEFKDREQASLRKQTERRNRISEKAMARKPPVDAPTEHIKIRAAGHH
jgi:alkanesulfonate monooxygenase SsuD/methylene tetrahydromethanopterin reductase-like flavin-dependent oxidoreductase (luciferase family)